MSLEHASSNLKADPEIVKIAVSKNGCALKYASAELRADRGIVEIAVGQHGHALRYAPEALQADYDIVKTAVSHSGEVMSFASPALKADREIIMMAVRNFGWALLVASDELKADRGVVERAVGNSGTALNFASDELKAHRGIVEIALHQDGRALNYASADLYNDTDLLALALRRGFDGDRFQGHEIAGRLRRLQAQGKLQGRSPNTVFEDEQAVRQGAMAFRDYMWQNIYPIYRAMHNTFAPVGIIVEYSDIHSGFAAANDLERLASAIGAFAYRGIAWGELPDWVLQVGEEDSD